MHLNFKTPGEFDPGRDKQVDVGLASKVEIPVSRRETTEININPDT
jgi:hypothetical protein